MKRIQFRRLDSPIGTLIIGVFADLNALASIEFDEHAFMRHSEALKYTLTHTHANSFLNAIYTQLEEYFAQKRQEFSTGRLQCKGTSFQKAVWTEVQSIPYGETRSYSDIANTIHSPKSMRAVGQANRYNPLAIIIPCHRVLGKNKHLRGYRWGLTKQAWLLQHELTTLDAQ